MKEKETVNIYFKNDDVKNDVLKGASAHEKYIIIQNQTLQQEHRDLSFQIKELELKIKEIEDENETYDESKRYIRGLLKNLVELERFREKISDINQTIAENIKDTIQEYMKTQIRLFRFLQILFTVIFSIVFNFEIFDIFQFCIFLICVMISLGFTELLFYNFVIPKYEHEMKDIEELEVKIKQIHQTEDFLHKYIECL
jgi:hypothetical protein